MRKSEIRVLLATGVLASLLATPVFAQSKAATEPQSTLFLAGTCTSCHGSDGAGSSFIPPLAGKDKRYLNEQLKLYKTDVLKVTLMNQLSKGYSDDELTRLAEHFSKKK